MVARNSHADIARLREKVRSDREAMITTLQTLVRFPTVNPVGEGSDTLSDETRAALAFMVEHAGALGLSARNLDNIVGYVELGPPEAAETIGVLVHLDVVPAGEGWTHPPFGGEIADGMIWGRGVEDNKGPAVSVLYAMKALRELNVPLHRKIRLILGTHEEGGSWNDIAYYREREGVPTMGFAPDANYPVICGEKGMMTIELRATDSAPLRRSRYTIVGWHAGTVSNIVPAWAWAALSIEGIGLANALDKLAGAINRFAGRSSAVRLRAYSHADFVQAHPRDSVPACDVVIAAEGIEAHAAMPWDGHNAMLDLAGLLAELELTSNAHGRLARFIAERLGTGWDGAGLAIATDHEKLGPTTVSLGLARSEGNRASITLNIRFTPPLSMATVTEKVKHAGQLYGLEAVAGPVAMEPLFVDEHDPLVTALNAAYSEVTGEPAGYAYIGGTTYAKAFPRTVAFGPLMAGEEVLAHQVNERVSLDSIVRNAEIYALALYYLAVGAEPTT